jgi:hypothetical protein
MDKPPAPAPPQSSQSTGSLAQPQMMGNNPFQQSMNTNPYGVAPSQSQYGLNQAFQNMAISSSQPLFPNHTGGFPGPQQQQFQQLHQQSMTPPVPSLPQQYYPSVIYENPAQQPQNYNPFMQQQQPQQQVRQAPPINTNFQSNPYTQQQPTSQATPVNTNFQSNPYAQTQVPTQNYVQSPMEQPNSGIQQQNPFFQSNQQQQQPFNYQAQPQPQAQQQYQQYRGQTHPLVPQQTGRADKRSILELYNYPQLAPTPLQHSQQQNQAQPAPLIDTQQQQRSVSSPASAPAGGSRNPFTINEGGPQNTGADTMGNMPIFSQNQNGTRHVSQESIDVGGWQSGRHSPDAWGTISARSMR